MKEDNNNLQTDMRKAKDTISFLTKKYETVILQAMNVNKANEQNEELINKIVLSTWKLLNIPKFQFFVLTFFSSSFLRIFITKNYEFI